MTESDTSPPDYPSVIYQAPSKRTLSQGDIALCEFHQLRSNSGSDPKGPGKAELQSDALPYLGPFEDYPIEIPSPTGGRVVTRVLRVWRGWCVVLSQNCELDNADEDDSRILVAPIAARQMWPEGRWDRFERNAWPGFMYLPGLDEEAASAFKLPAAWPEGVVVFASSTLVSHAMIKPSRQLRLTYPMLPVLQERLVKFLSVRGFGDSDGLERLIGKRIVAVKDTGETLFGPSRLHKVFVEDEGVEDIAGDELTVTLGVRQ